MFCSVTCVSAAPTPFNTYGSDVVIDDARLFGTVLDAAQVSSAICHASPRFIENCIGTLPSVVARARNTQPKNNSLGHEALP